MRLSHIALTLAGASMLAWLPLSATPATPLAPFEDDLLRDATAVFHRVTEMPAAAVPASVLMHARAVFVIPAARRETEGYRGVGVLSARGIGLESWTPPAVVAFQGAIPVELEADDADFVLIAQTARGLDLLAENQLAGPLARPMIAGPLMETRAQCADADLVAYVQFGDYFAGVTVDNWEIAEVRPSNERLYGRPYSTNDILRGAGFFHLPDAARLWRQALANYLRSMS